MGLPTYKGSLMQAVEICYDGFNCYKKTDEAILTTLRKYENNNSPILINEWNIEAKSGEIKKINANET